MKNCKAILSVLALCCATSAHALTIDSVSVTRQTGSVHFSLTLSGVPELATFDQYGRPKDQFGFWITHTLKIDPYHFPEKLFTSGYAPGAVVAWDGETGDSLATIPYAIAVSTISFDMPSTLLSGEIGWHCVLFRYGLDVDGRRGIMGIPIGGEQPTPLAAMTWGRLKALYARR